MILQGDKLKNACRKEGLAALCQRGASVKCHFDNGQEFYAKKSGKTVFSWHAKGDFTIPLLPFAVGAALCAVALSQLFSQKSNS